MREEDIQKQVDWLLLLCEATRYSYYTPTPVQFLQEVQCAINISENFSRQILYIEQEPAQTREENLFTPGLSETSSRAEQNPMEGENDVQAQLLATLLAIQQSTNRVGAIPFPEYKGGMQDPMEWIESFEKTAQVNNYDPAAKLQVVSAYLRDEPSYWFETQN